MGLYGFPVILLSDTNGNFVFCSIFRSAESPLYFIPWVDQTPKQTSVFILCPVWRGISTIFFLDEKETSVEVH